MVDDLADPGSVRQHKEPDTVAIHWQTAGVDQRIIHSEDGNGNSNEAEKTTFMFVFLDLRRIKNPSILRTFVNQHLRSKNESPAA